MLRQSRLQVVGILAGLCALVSSACQPTSIINAVLGNELTNPLRKNLPTIRIVNKTGNQVVLDVLIDGTEQRLSCAAINPSCDTELDACPKRVEAVRQQVLDSQGRFVGGRTFNGSAQFTFVEGEFECRAFLVYEFTETDANAFAL